MRIRYYCSGAPRMHGVRIAGIMIRGWARGATRRDDNDDAAVATAAAAAAR